MNRLRGRSRPRSRSGLRSLESVATMPPWHPSHLNDRCLEKNAGDHAQGRVRKEAFDRITTLHPRTYNEARTIGESFREGTPVIMNLSDMDDSDAKRLVDFAAGLVFGLHGSIERVTQQGVPAVSC